MHKRKRCRIYNSDRGYFFFSRSNMDLYEIHGKTVKVTKYFTKKIENKKYFSGRVILPSKLCRNNFREYCLIRLGRTHLLYGKKDLWGYSYIIFIRLNITSAPCVFRINTKAIHYKKLKENYSKFSKHTRKTNGKKYSSLKFYLPPELIGKEIYIIRFKKIIKLTHFKKITDKIIRKAINQKKNKGK